MLNQLNLVPLTKGQLSIWYLDQIESDSAHYNIAAAITLTPQIDVGLLDKTFNILLERHEALRSQIVVNNGKVFQSILPFAKIKISEHNAEQIDNTQLTKIMRNKSQQRFDLNNEIPMRIEIYQKTTHSIMFFCVHHMFSDFWSIALLIEEFTQIYASLKSGVAVKLKPIGLSYSQYCQALSTWSTSKQAKRAQSYWLNKLIKPVPELHLFSTNLSSDSISHHLLATDSLSNDSSTNNSHSKTHMNLDNIPANPQALKGKVRIGSHLKLKLNEKETTQILKQAQTLKCTPFSVLLAYYFKLLNKISGETDIIVGVPFLGRSKAKERLTVGYLVNPLPILCRKIDKKTVDQLSIQISHDVREAISRQRYPFSDIAKQYTSDRKMNSTPVFQTMFSYQQAQKGDSDWLAALTVEDDSITFCKSELSIQSFPIEPSVAQFEISMVMALVEKQFSIDIQYNSNLVSTEQVNSFASNFRKIVSGDETVFSTQTSERTNTHCLKYKNIATSILEIISEYPDNIALHQHGISMSYQELGQSCRLWIELLTENGLKAGDNAALILPQGVVQITATIAIILMGGFVAQLDIKTPRNRLEHCIQKCQPKIIISQQDMGFGGNHANLLVSDYELYKLTFSDPIDLASSLINENKGGALVFTSGSTGKPRCVVLSQDNLSYFTQVAISTYQISQSDVMLQFTSPGFDAYYEEVLPTLAVGATLVPKPSELTTDNEQFEAYLSKHKITIISLPTAFWHAWMQQLSTNKVQALPDLTRVIIGGEVMSIEKQQIWHANMPSRIRLINTYGPSETTVTATWYIVEKKFKDVIPIGHPLPGTQLLVLGKNQQSVSGTQTGELYIQSPGLSSGYLDDVISTEKRFVNLPSVTGKWFVTGDIVYRDASGILFFNGRIDHQIKFHGVRIEPAEVEGVLCSYNNITDAVVMLYKSKLIAFVESNDVIDKQECIAHLSKYFIKEMIPSDYIQIVDFPKTSGGKIDRNLLKEQYYANTISKVIQSRTNLDMEKLLEKLFSQWLETTIDSQKSFFEQGMDSLSAVTIACSLSENFSTKIPVRMLFDYPYIQSLSQNISKIKSSKIESSKIEPSKTRPYLISLVRESQNCSKNKSKNKIPLTNPQKRVMFLNHFLQEKNQANICLALQLDGQLDSLKFSLNWNKEVNSRDVFKLIFSKKKPFSQSIDKMLNHELNYITNLNKLHCFDIFECLNKPEQFKNIDLNSLFEQVFHTKPSQHFASALIKISSMRHLFLIKVHPLVCDIDSLEILLASFQHRYNDSQPIQKTPSSYFDYAKISADLPSTQDYWSNLLNDCHAAPQLSIRKKHSKPSGKFNKLKVQIEPSIAFSLKALASKYHITPAAMFFAAYYAVLMKNTIVPGKFVIGTAVSDRGSTRIQGNANFETIGPFSNFCLAGIDITGDSSFLEVLKESQNSLMGAVENQQIPLDDLLSLLPKTSSGLPVECVYLYQSSPERTFSLSDVTTFRLSDNQPPIPALLCLEVTALENNFYLSITFDTGVYESTSVECFVQSIKTLLIQSTNPHQIELNKLKLNQINFIPEHLQKLCQGKAIEWKEKETLLHTTFTTTAKKRPLRTAIINNHQKISYGQLYRLSTRISRVIYKYREKSCPLYVGVFMEKSWEQIVATLGILRGGGTYAPININLTEQQVNNLLDNTDIRVVITTPLYKKLYSWPENITVMTLDDSDVRTANVIPLRKKKVDVDRTDPAYIMFTSGTMGNPKGVVISHQSALNTIFDINHKINLSSKDCIFGLSNSNFDLSVYDIFGTFSKGAKLVLPDHERMLEPSHWETLIRQHKVTIWNSVPALYRLMLDNLSVVNQGLRKVLLSGDWITLDLPALSTAKFPSAEIISLGGATEVSIWSVVFPIKGVKKEWTSIPYGLPLANQGCYVLDEHQNMCPPDVAGELYISGRGVAIEYHKNNQATVDSFVVNSTLDKRLYKTGDAAKLSSKGYFEILGRLDNRIKIAGQFVDSSEVESIIDSLEAVAQCAVVGWEEKGESSKLAAFMVLNKNSNNGLDTSDLNASNLDTTSLNTLNNSSNHLVLEIQKALSQSLPRHMLPSKMTFLSELPLTANGKVDRGNLEKFNGQFISIRTGVKKPETHLQKLLANIWKKFLKCDDINLDDNFFELGGDSLMVVGILSAIKKEVGIVLPIQNFLLYQTIQELAHVISAGLNKTLDKTNQPDLVDSLLKGELTGILNLEVHLDASIDASGCELIQKTLSKHVLLTGATGYLGSRLLLSLLQNTKAVVYCLVRNIEDISGFERILEKVEKIQSLSPQQVERIIPVKGDLSKPLLGLTEQEFDLLAVKIDQILHCGAQVNFLLPRSNLKAINIDGTIELLRLATRFKLKRFGYISTVSVFPTIAKNLKKTFYEDDSIDQPLPIVGGYPQSKWIAEKTILLARARGVPVNIIRPGVIFGDTRINDLPEEVLLVDFLRICIDLQAIPNLDILIDVAPVDYVANAIVYICQSSNNSNFHLTNPKPLPLSNFIDLLTESGIVLRKVSPLKWTKLLDKIDDTRASDGIKTLISLFENVEKSGAIIFGRNLQHFECSNTLTALKGSSIECPPINKNFIEVFKNALV